MGGKGSGRPNASLKLWRAVQGRTDDVSREAKGFLLRVARGEVRASVGAIRTRCHAYLELLDRLDGKPVQTVTLNETRQPGTVIIGDPDRPDSRPLPLPTGPPN